MKKFRFVVTAIPFVLVLVPALTAAKKAQGPDLEQAVSASFPNLTPEWKAKVDQDETDRACSMYRNDPPAKVAAAIVARERASIVYPADGKYMGDWKKGEKGAQSGYGFRMRDKPDKPAGGNCYACHQLTPTEVSYGTLGPSLLGYGKIKGQSPEAQKEVYAKIYDAQAVLACSNMPRFGHNKVLSPEHIPDFVALLLDPESPVNKGQ
jgi:sulfur-oxidizing protein SoxX